MRRRLRWLTELVTSWLRVSADPNVEVSNCIEPRGLLKLVGTRYEVDETTQRTAASAEHLGIREDIAAMGAVAHVAIGCQAARQVHARLSASRSLKLAAGE